ncbi:MAG: O-methyltransferase [Candidatus Zipacnadales bacterium]
MSRPLTRLVAVVCILMALSLWRSPTLAEQAMDERLQQVDPLLRALEPLRRQNLNVPRSHGQFLRMLVEMTGAKQALEIGTSNGYSAIWIGLGLEKTGGKLQTIEIVPERAAEARQNMVKAGLAEVVECITGDALEIIPQLKGPFDFVFIDALKSDYGRYYELVRPKLVAGAVIAAHNAISARSELTPYFQMLEADPNLQTTVVQIDPGDGFAVTYVREKPQ